MIHSVPVCSVLGLLMLPASVIGADYYAAPNGSATNDGSISRPWNLSKAFGANGELPGPKPGDTVWLRGGTYTGVYEVHAAGAPGAPIIYRQYPGERARLDGGSDQRYALNAMGDYIWFWGFEVFSSNPVRVSSQTGSFPTDILRGPEVGAMASPWGEVNAIGVKFINMILHDGFNSFLAKEAVDTEAYGNIFYYDGWDAPDRGHGHSLYAQNSNTSTKSIVDNIMMRSFSHGLHIYSTEDMQNFNIEGNVAFDNGTLAVSGYTRNYLIGYGGRPSNIVFKNNYSYYSPSKPGGAGLLLGSLTMGCGTSTVTNNYLATPASVAMELEPGCSPTMSGNTFYGTLTGFVSSQYPGNTYYTSSNKPTGVQVFIRPNKYEPGRANVIIYNWSLQNSVQVNPTGVLAVGDSFEIRDAQNFYGPAVVTGTYNGGNISIPMNGTSVSPVISNSFISVAHTSAEFGVFVILRQGAGSNAAPFVNAGPNQTVNLPSPVTLAGTATDDGLPSGSTLTVSWSKVSGPGTVTFANPASASTTATLSAAGTYVLRLTASDSALTSTSDVTVVAQLITDTTPPSISAITAGSLTSSGATITWTTNEAADQQVEFGPTTSYGQSTAVDSTMAASHSVPLSALMPSTTYHYRVKSRDAAGNLATSGDKVFTTLSAGASVNIPIAADSGVLVAPMAATATAGGSGPATAISSPVANSGTATYTVNVPTGGSYIIWCQVLASDSSADSFFVSANGGAEDIYDMAEGTWSTSWQWTMVNGRNGGNPLTLNPRIFTLNAGPNTVVFRGREANSILGSLIVTNDFSFNPANAATNQAPVVNAGSGQTITLPGSATLNGTATDDGLPTGSTLSVTWSKVSGPGTVTFSNPKATSTTASFSAAGTYVLRLSATDTALTSTSDVTIVVNGSTTTNQAPVVSAGPGQTITLPNSASLNGSATDDGLPTGSTLSVTWSKVSGPGTVTFSNPKATSTTASFSAAGTYVLRLSATDSALTSTSDVTIVVNASGDTQPPVISGVAANAVGWTNATINWKTDKPADQLIEYGTTAAYGQSTVLDKRLNTKHSIQLIQLNRGTTYHFRVKSRDAAGNLAVSPDSTFTTKK